MNYMDDENIKIKLNSEKVNRKHNHLCNCKHNDDELILN
jgi:hypothetical protein